MELCFDKGAAHIILHLRHLGRLAVALVCAVLIAEGMLLSMIRTKCDATNRDECQIRTMQYHQGQGLPCTVSWSAQLNSQLSVFMFEPVGMRTHFEACVGILLVNVVFADVAAALQSVVVITSPGTIQLVGRSLSCLRLLPRLAGPSLHWACWSARRTQRHMLHNRPTNMCSAHRRRK